MNPSEESNHVLKELSNCHLYNQESIRIDSVCLFMQCTLFMSFVNFGTSSALLVMN